MPGGRQAYMPAVKVCFLPRSVNSPSRIQTSSQKSWTTVSLASTPVSNCRSRVTSPSSLRLRIFCLPPAPPAPPAAEAATGSQGKWSGLKNSSSALGMVRRLLSREEAVFGPPGCCILGSRPVSSSLLRDPLLSVLVLRYPLLPAIDQLL